MKILNTILVIISLVINLNLSMMPHQNRIEALMHVIKQNINILSANSRNYDLTSIESTKLYNINVTFHDVMLMMCIVLIQKNSTMHDSASEMILQQMQSIYKAYAKHCISSNIFDENTIKQSFQNAIKKIISKNQIELQFTIDDWFTKNALLSIEDIPTQEEQESIKEQIAIAQDMLHAFS